MMPRIIDRDIEFYQGDAEFAGDMIARVEPSREQAYKDRRDAAEAVVRALKLYRVAIDSGDFGKVA